MSRLAFFALFAALTLQAQTAPGNGSITGRVYNVLTGEGISGASLHTWASSNANFYNAPPDATSQSDGSFHLDGLPAGLYRITVEKEGYVSTRDHTLYFPWVRLQDGESASGIQIPLTPDGGLIGVVRDGNAAPVAGALVQAMTLGGHDIPLRLQTAGGQATTDSAGRYSLTKLPPGNYYVAVVPDARSVKSGNDGYQPVATLYPSALSKADASAVQVQAGESSTADIKVQTVLTHRLQGKLSELPNSIPQKSLRLVLEPEDAPNVAALRRPLAIQPNNTFSLSSVPSGSYRLSLYGGGGRRTRLLSRQQVEVGSDDVSGIVVHPSDHLTLTGKITQEGAAAQTSQIRANVRAIPVEDENRLIVAATPNGSFTLDGLDAGRYLVDVQTSQSGLYVSSLTLNGRDILNQIVDLSLISGGEIQAVLRSSTAQISGTVPNDTPLMVILVPHSLAPDGSNVKIGYPQAGGTFSFANIAPGDYTLYAADRANTRIWLQPTFLQAIQNLGTAAHVDENGSARVELSLTGRESLEDQALRLGLSLD